MNYDILVVDDSKATLFMFQKIVRLSGAPIGTILTAENGVQALEVLRDNNAHLVITDINMPEMDGFELIKNLKAGSDHKHIPIIVITTEGRGKYINKAMDLGAVNYITKPFQPERVKRVILETLGVEEDETNIDDTDASDF